MDVRAIYDRLRDPAYTGRNRCLACTAVNAVLGALVAGLAALVAPSLGLAVLGVAAATVWLRGYLVPSTPRLTRRYLPDRLHARFEASEPPPTDDPAAALVSLGVLEAADDEPALTPWFRRRFRAAAAEHRSDDALARYVAGALSAPPDAVALEPPPGPAETGGIAATVDGSWVGTWPSRAALVADAATHDALSTRPAWTDDLDHAARADLAGRIRGFVDRCPRCDGPVTGSETAVTSCCRETEVLARSCEDCEARLVELDPDPFAPG
jgi:hypothetical protein